MDRSTKQKINKETQTLNDTIDPPQNKGHIQTESEGLEKDIPCK